jgi:hypothetical protein
MLLVHFRGVYCLFMVNPGDGASKFLWNIDTLLTYSMASYPKASILHTYHLRFLRVALMWYMQKEHKYMNRKSYLTNSLELSPSWEAASCAATEEFPKILWNPKVHYHVQKSPPLVPILNQINPVHTTPSYLRSILILSTHLCLCLPSGLFPSGFPNQTYMHSSSPHKETNL